MNVPALAARPPAGETHTITGTGDSRNAPVIFWVASRLPPGVLSSTRTAGAPSRSARAIPSARYWAITPSTSPVVGRTMTAGPAALTVPASATSASASVPTTSGMKRTGTGRRISTGSSASMHPRDATGPGKRPCRGWQAGRCSEAVRLVAARAGRPSPHPGAAAADEVEDQLAPCLHPFVDGEHVARRDELSLELVGLANRDGPAACLRNEDHADVDAPYLRLVVVEQAHQAKLRDEPRVQLLGPFAREAAGQVRVARVEVSADPDREPVVEARVGSRPCAPHEEVAAAVAQDQVWDDLLEARIRLHGGAWGEPALPRDDGEVRLGALVQYATPAGRGHQGLARDDQHRLLRRPAHLSLHQRGARAPQQGGPGSRPRRGARRVPSPPGAPATRRADPGTPEAWQPAR